LLNNIIINGKESGRRAERKNKGERKEKHQKENRH
jgi:hypothetical protein